MLVVIALFSLVTTAAPALAHQRQILLASCFLVLAGYFTYCWRNGQTLGMRAWRMRIEDVNGQRVTWGRACVRYLLSWVWVAPPLALVAYLKPYTHSISSVLQVAALATFAWVILWSLASLLHPQRQFWHDAVAGTRLVPA